MSTRIDATIANANAAPSCAVNCVVCVMKPGPIALVAIRNMAPSTGPRLAERVVACGDSSFMDLPGGSP